VTRADRLLLALAQYQQGRIDRATFLTKVHLVLDAPPDGPPVIAPPPVVEAPRAPIEHLVVVSVKEAAIRCGVRTGTIYAWIANGDVEVFRDGGSVRIVLASLLSRRVRPRDQRDNRPADQPDAVRGGQCAVLPTSPCAPEDSVL